MISSVSSCTPQAECTAGAYPGESLGAYTIMAALTLEKTTQIDILTDIHQTSTLCFRLWTWMAQINYCEYHRQYYLAASHAKHENVTDSYGTDIPWSVCCLSDTAVTPTNPDGHVAGHFIVVWMLGRYQSSRKYLMTVSKGDFKESFEFE